MAMNGELLVLQEGPKFSELNYQLYLGDWNQLPDFDQLTPHRSGPIADKTFTIELEGMAQHFGVRYDGILPVPKNGEYEFHLASDDGSQLFINGKSVLKNDGIHPSSQLKSRRVKLKKGP